MKTARKPDTTSQIGKLMNGYVGRQVNVKTARKQDTTSQIWKPMNGYVGREKNLKKTRHPPARLGNT